MDNKMTPKRPYLFRSMYEWLCDNDTTPYLVVDATVEGVIVPTEHVSDGQIVLNLAPHAIGYINIEDHGVAFSARFNGKSMDLYAPMSAVIALYAKENGEGMVFPPEHFEQAVTTSDSRTQFKESIKPELGVVPPEPELQRESAEKPSAENKSAENKSDTNGSGNFNEKIDSTEKPKSKAPHLKIIK